MRIVQFYLLLLLFLSGAQAAFGQGKIVGKVTDEDGEPLPYITVVLPDDSIGATTNRDGYYTISGVSAGEHKVAVQSAVHVSAEQTVNVPAGGAARADFALKEASLEDIVILDNAVQINRQKAEPGQVRIQSGQIKALPSLGTPDLAQYLQVLPGVVFTGDQGGQLYIRGGTPIQNMTIFDGAIIYNPFHTIGLYSIFDTEIIRNADVYSGGFPAEYGGRISSVMNIETRNGSFKSFGGSAHINPITAGALVEGPLFKGKDSDLADASYMLSVRNCYLNQTSQSLYSHVNDSSGLPFSFTDLYGKVSIGSGSNQVNLFGFYQTDNVEYGYPSDYSWDASGGGVNFSLLPPNSSVIMSGNFAVSNFSNEQLNVDENYPRRSLINGFNARLNFDHIVNNINQFTYGFQLLGFGTDLEFTNSLGDKNPASKRSNTEMAAYAKYRHVFLDQRPRKRRAKSASAFERLVLEPGIRLHYYNDQSKRHAGTEVPREIQCQPAMFSFSLATGMFSQNLISAVSDRDVVTLFQGFLAAPDNLPDALQNHSLQTAWHLLGAVEYQFNAKTKITLEGWYKDFTQLTNINRARLFPEDPNFITETGDADRRRPDYRLSHARFVALCDLWNCPRAARRRPPGLQSGLRPPPFRESGRQLFSRRTFGAKKPDGKWPINGSFPRAGRLARAFRLPKPRGSFEKLIVRPRRLADRHCHAKRPFRDSASRRTERRPPAELPSAGYFREIPLAGRQRHGPGIKRQRY